MSTQSKKPAKTAKPTSNTALAKRLAEVEQELAATRGDLNQVTWLLAELIAGLRQAAAQKISAALAPQIQKALEERLLGQMNHTALPGSNQEASLASLFGQASGVK